MKTSSNMNIRVCAAAAVLLVVLLLGEASVSVNGAGCNPVQLSPCAPAIASNSRPTGDCCNRMKQQKLCFCQYLKNPSLRPYINSPAARRVASACKVAIPKC